MNKGRFRYPLTPAFRPVYGLLAWLLAAATCNGELAPSGRDWTQLWWEDGVPVFHGFLGHDRAVAAYSADRGQLRLETGYYGLVMDTETVTLERWGLRDSSDGWAGNEPLASGLLAESGLAAVVTVGGTDYRLAGRLARATDARQYLFPVRIVESGRYYQHWVVADLRFEDEAGAAAPVTARLEIRAWPDRLQFELVVRLTDDQQPAAEAMRLRLRLQAPDGERTAAGGEAMAGDAATRSLTWSWHADGEHTAPATGAGITAVARYAATTPVAIETEGGTGEHRIVMPALPWRVGGPFPEQHLHDRHTVRLRLTNDSAAPRSYALLFEHPPLHMTGFVPILMSVDGEPTGLPVQISKNWHQGKAEWGEIEYLGPWSHGRTIVRLAGQQTLELDYTLVHAYWGGLPTASVSQLSLIGWGFNGFWDQWALGSFGETICLQPGRQLRRAFITDLRPVLVESFGVARRWTWTSNVGGGDIMMLLDGAGQYLPLKQSHSRYDAYGPNLADVVYREQTANDTLVSTVRAMLPQSEDYVRMFFHLRVDVKQAQAFQRLAFFQMGTEYYNESEPGLVATGNRAGLGAEWPVPELEPWTEVRAPLAATGADAWISLHGLPRDDAARYGQATRGMVVRSWRARLGGVDDVAPFWHFWATQWNNRKRLSVMLGPPPGVSELVPGDFVECLVEWVVQPLAAERYYGGDASFRRLLEAHANSWQPVWHAAADYQPQLEVEGGVQLVSGIPLEYRVPAGTTALPFEFRNGRGTAAVRFSGLPSPFGHVLEIQQPDGGHVAVQPAAGGPAYWQTDYEPATASWALTYSLPAAPAGQRYRLRVGGGQE
jgi:hypothetical protein